MVLDNSRNAEEQSGVEDITLHNPSRMVKVTHKAVDVMPHDRGKMLRSSSAVSKQQPWPPSCQQLGLQLLLDYKANVMIQVPVERTYLLQPIGITGLGTTLRYDVVENFRDAVGVDHV